MSKFWIYNIPLIFSDYLNLIPNINNNIIDNLNILSRLYFYLIIILILLKKNIYIPLFGLILIILYFIIYNFIINKYDDSNKNKCSMPTINNPYMNYIDNINKKNACNINNKKVNKEISNYTNYYIFDYIYDLYYKNKFDRFFYTKPYNTFIKNYNNLGKGSYKLD